MYCIYEIMIADVSGAVSVGHVLELCRPRLIIARYYRRDLDPDIRQEDHQDYASTLVWGENVDRRPCLFVRRLVDVALESSVRSNFLE